ncbi:Pimeloyl-ACP methyl ester carboxylesterase [Chitinophaga sp. CF118]|nr:Pimeloyl-ACP methyl ester carboxylesterase [Chitinophaga sp. CF118]
MFMRTSIREISYYPAILWLMVMLIAGCQTNPGKQSTSAVNDSTAITTEPASPPSNFKHASAKVNGIDIHYVVGGEGEPLVLLHGFGQNWYMWNRLLPELSKHFTVIAPDLPGLGESGKPDSGYDKKALAGYIHGLVKQLGYNNINLAGHDIGLMIAYAYAAQFSGEVKKLALMDALLPGVEPVWSQVKASAWWFGFFSFPASGELVAGRERLFLTNFWPVVGHVKNAFTTEETNEFVRAYSTKGSTAGAFQWFAAFEQDTKDNKVFMKTKLKMPLLAMGGEYFGAGFLVDHCKLIAENVKGSNIKGAGHWIVQENTEQVQKDLLDFFMAN